MGLLECRSARHAVHGREVLLPTQVQDCASQTRLFLVHELQGRSTVHWIFERLGGKSQCKSSHEIHRR